MTKNEAEAMIGELYRNGKTVHYVWPVGGTYREGSKLELLKWLMDDKDNEGKPENKYVMLTECGALYSEDNQFIRDVQVSRHAGDEWHAPHFRIGTGIWYDNEVQWTGENFTQLISKYGYVVWENN
jgi:hypothetical protein